MTGQLFVENPWSGFLFVCPEGANKLGGSARGAEQSEAPLSLRKRNTICTTIFFT